MKKSAWYAAGMLLCVLLIWFKGFPELPTADPMMSTIVYDISARAFLWDNLFALSFFIASMFCGLCLVFYGIYAKCKAELFSTVSDAAGVLGIFVLLTGVWILTDSRFFALFKDTAGDSNFSRGIVFVSFVSFLLIPIVYAEFLQRFVKGKKFIHIIERLMKINLLLFLILMILDAPPVAFLVVLFIQHVLIVVLIAMNIKVYFKDLFCTCNPREHNLSMGTTAFGVISMAALVIFMLGDYRSYPMVYGTGLMILIFFMVKLLFAEIAQVYRTQMQANIYKEMAYLDALTGLQNRNAYIRDTSAITDTEGLGIIILDINNVKYVNDTYGHECGDMMIRAAADVIKHAFGSLGAAYRIGGDEFAVICHRVDEDAIKRAIAMADVLQRDYHCKDEIRLSIAVGYAVDGIPGAGESVSSLMAKADENMYEDKAVKKKHL